MNERKRVVIDGGGAVRVFDQDGESVLKVLLFSSNYKLGCWIKVPREVEDLILEYIKGGSLLYIHMAFYHNIDEVPLNYDSRDNTIYFDSHYLFNDRDYLLEFLAGKLDIGLLRELRKLGVAEVNRYRLKNNFSFHTKVMDGIRNEKYSDVVDLLTEWSIERILR